MKEAKEGGMKEAKDSWTDVIYNRRSGEFLGRTSSSWGLILLFYLVFYGVLAGMFSLTIWVLLQTLDENVPRHQDRIANPGLVIHPHTSEIIFNRSNAADYSQYTQQLHNLLQWYNDSVQGSNDLCLVGEYTEQEHTAIKKVCQFKRSILQQCSGLGDSSFGYADGKPCVLIKMNRVVGLKPQGDPYIHCTAKSDAQLRIQYFPEEARLDKMFFPYYGKKAHPNYVQPMVAVKLLFSKQDYDAELRVECKLEGTNLRNNDERDKFMGRVSFQVKVSE
ncbi:sodium/potassium-transporting ATPase subunit beta-3-like isoform X1 [Takifugu rubripes]|uniref:Sodium/potassium-transporting ATPase subunit beta n=2 Tax=Takifugu rubripes TaxID=31033 RepID=H2VA06_TAKRU|nr:sodium/potassium-transporting ATPase subunit beta-3-like isoform X1 [Takifugu rubripes]XP_029700201.1 sodium/potassium-transporting ATPase subunit beta-3-like isoform X1 [Takifugu rubripes]XP_029700227.1 sodium/potassium-transporting ATPase subunit beta-3-like isoform X1 [Takifugu rubripes]XP_029700228.1 sodium/potassium-transporting ATPase subunit beta-3-like isoform X1 [Takifugu rubripes]XP_029700229.1 sodium/potassium-transporting ATPase subunit beta-3-like isoform X1 [Takifugu rubripes]